MTAGDRDVPAGEPAFRIEHDSMGDVRVPADALWGAQTQRAVTNLPVSGMRIDRIPLAGSMRHPRRPRIL